MVVSVKVTRLHTDISTKTGERVIIFTLLENLEAHDAAIFS
ncbi:MAG: Na-translocating system protein MpsC family protein [Nitrospiria bacterium]